METFLNLSLLKITAPNETLMDEDSAVSEMFNEVISFPTLENLTIITKICKSKSLPILMAEYEF